MRNRFVFSHILVAAMIFLATICSLPLRAQDSSAASDSVSAARQPLITQPVDESQLTVLKGNTHPLARPAFDLGSAPASLPMLRMLLVLKRSPEQETALRKLLDDQQDKASPNYHNWLTPDQFGKQFGPTDADIQTITAWLQSHGFQVSPTKGRAVMEFSGSASQVQEAFHTSIHKYIVNGEQHWANSSDPKFPTALTPAVAGVLTLHNFLKKPQIHVSEHPIPGRLIPGKKPQTTFSDGTHALGPQDYAVIYNSPAFLTGGATGSGVTIGIVGRSNLFNGGQDVSNFANDVFSCCGNFNIVLNGPDPGDLGGGEEAEATLDTTWSGAVAPGASVDFVVSATTNTTDGVDLSEVYIIENNLSDIMTESFGSCEAAFTSADAAGVSALAEQAAAQGITYFVSTGDEGAEGCDDPNSETVATGPVSANLLASTPFNVAVGGTMFNENGKTTYWSSTNNGQESAISYIPEDVWNESCTATTCTGSATPNIWAGSGGASIFFAKPSWQSGLGLNIPNDNHRDLPDVSLTSASHDPYLLCLEGSCVPNAQGQFFIFFVWGTSAAAPSFAGVTALVEQNQLSLGQSRRQGQANYVLYQLAAKQVANKYQCNGSSQTTPPDLTHCIFNDTTIGNNAVPGEVNYGLSTAQYQAGTGYDLATGLGSVNITNLVSNWNSVSFNSTVTTLSFPGSTPPITVAHGTSVNVLISVTANSGTPAGDVSLIASVGSNGQTSVPLFAASSGPQVFTLSSGSLAASTAWLPGSPVVAGSPVAYNVTAHYAGSNTSNSTSTFAPSDSSAVQVTVTPEGSTTTLAGPFTLNQSGQWTVPVTTPQAFGTPIFVAAAVNGSSGVGTPTGNVTFSSSPGTIPNASTASLNSQGTASIQSNPFLVGGPTVPFDAGSYTVSASYVGDASFNASSSTTPVSFTIQPGFVAVSGPADVTITSPGASGTTTVGIITSSNFATKVSFTCSGLPAEAACNPASATGKGPNTVVNTTITVTTMGPHTVMLQPSQRHYYFAAILGGGLPLAGLFLIGAPRRRRWSMPLGLMAVALIVMLAACGGGGHSTPPPQQDPGTPAGTYTVTVTATAGAISQQGTFTLTVQ